MKFTHLAAGALAAALGVAALAGPAAAQTYLRNYGSGYDALPGPVYEPGYYAMPGERGIMYTQPRYVSPTRRYVVVEPADPYGAEIVHGYGNQPMRVMPSLTRTGFDGQPCYTVEKRNNVGLLRTYTYCR